MAVPATTPNPRIRPYRRFLTSALHNRFVVSAAISYIVCLDHAFWISDKGSWLWSWFPIGPAGFKAALLFISCLLLLVLRVSTLSIGVRSYTSPIANFRKLVLSPVFVQTFICYSLSAWWFSEVYSFCSPASAGLEWVTKGDLGTPDRLNERPIYLRNLFTTLALVQTFVHLYTDVSAIQLPLERPDKDQKTLSKTHKLSPVLKQVITGWKSHVLLLGATSASAIVLTPIIYSLFLRQRMWHLHLMFGKLFYDLPRSNAQPRGITPFTSTFWPGLITSLLLLTLWTITNVSFSIFFAQEPTKNNLPLTAGSQDPNGSLLSGLKTKKDLVKTFAMWELAIISENLPERRRTIFADIQRPEGSCWKQIHTTNLAVIQTMNARVNPPPPQQTGPPQIPKVEPLPRLLPKSTVKPTSVQAPQPTTETEKALELVRSISKSIGQSTQIWEPTPTQVKQKADELVKYTKLWDQDFFINWSLLFKSLSIGKLFTTPEYRRLNSIVLGNTTDHNNASIIVDAIESEIRLLLASLNEDPYGKVISDVPETVRVFVAAINGLEKLARMSSLDRSMMDNEVQDIETIFGRLISGLGELLVAFKLYLSDVGLGIAESNAAEKAAIERPLFKPSQSQDLGASMRRHDSHGATNDDQLSQDQPEMHEPKRKERDHPQPRQRGFGGRPPQPRTSSGLRKEWNPSNNIFEQSRRAQAAVR